MGLIVIEDLNNYDESRKLDILKMTKIALDPEKSPEERKKAEAVLDRIKDQNKSPAIRQQREKIRIAMMNGDQKRAEKLGEQMRHIDDQYAL